jgi:1-acyl-sn-glycerol-3-phosphate acyltransferase
VPLRFYPWVIADMTDPRRAPTYLYEDFVQPVLRLDGWPGAAFSKILAKITVPLLNRIGCISVEGYQRASPEAFKHSLELLAEGKNLLIFPEDEKSPSIPP